MDADGESDYSYSLGLAYNTYPMPPGDADLSRLEPLAQAVLDARAAHLLKMRAPLEAEDKMNDPHVAALLYCPVPPNETPCYVRHGTLCSPLRGTGIRAWVLGNLASGAGGR